MMIKNHPTLWAIGAGCVEAAYVFLVVTLLMAYGNNLNGATGAIAPLIMVSTLVFSVAVSGLLIFGYPVYLLIRHQWGLAIKFTITSIFAFLVVIIATVLISII
jgi:hypothetical protein